MPHLLHRVVVRDAEHEREIVLLTNSMDFGTTAIADTYKQRWQIEIFFKALKQNLKTKTFIGVSEDALLIQIWTALIALLLLRFLHHLSKARGSLSNLATQVRLNLFTYRDLRQWIDDPFTCPGRARRPAVPARSWIGGLSRAKKPGSAFDASTSSIPEDYGVRRVNPVLSWTAVTPGE
jgi:hypothetical protein